MIHSVDGWGNAVLTSGFMGPEDRWDSRKKRGRRSAALPPTEQTNRVNPILNERNRIESGTGKTEKCQATCKT